MASSRQENKWGARKYTPSSRFSTERLDLILAKLGGGGGGAGAHEPGLCRSEQNLSSTGRSWNVYLHDSPFEKNRSIFEDLVRGSRGPKEEEVEGQPQDEVKVKEEDNKYDIDTVPTRDTEAKGTEAVSTAANEDKDEIVSITSSGNDVASKEGHHNDSGFLDDILDQQERKAVSFNIDAKSKDEPEVDLRSSTFPRQARRKDGFVSHAKNWWQNLNQSDRSESTSSLVEKPTSPSRPSSTQPNKPATHSAQPRVYQQREQTSRGRTLPSRSTAQPAKSPARSKTPTREQRSRPTTPQFKDRWSSALVKSPEETKSKYEDSSGAPPFSMQSADAFRIWKLREELDQRTRQAEAFADEASWARPRTPTSVRPTTPVGRRLPKTPTIRPVTPNSVESRTRVRPTTPTSMDSRRPTTPTHMESRRPTTPTHIESRRPTTPSAEMHSRARPTTPSSETRSRARPTTPSSETRSRARPTTPSAETRSRTRPITPTATQSRSRPTTPTRDRAKSPVAFGSRVTPVSPGYPAEPRPTTPTNLHNRALSPTPLDPKPTPRDKSMYERATDSSSRKNQAPVAKMKARRIRPTPPANPPANVLTTPSQRPLSPVTYNRPTTPTQTTVNHVAPSPAVSRPPLRSRSADVLGERSDWPVAPPRRSRRRPASQRTLPTPPTNGAKTDANTETKPVGGVGGPMPRRPATLDIDSGVGENVFSSPDSAEIMVGDVNANNEPNMTGKYGVHLVQNAFGAFEPPPASPPTDDMISQRPRETWGKPKPVTLQFRPTTPVESRMRPMTPTRSILKKSPRTPSDELSRQNSRDSGSMSSGTTDGPSPKPRSAWQRTPRTGLRWPSTNLDKRTSPSFENLGKSLIDSFSPLKKLGGFDFEEDEKKPETDEQSGKSEQECHRRDSKRHKDRCRRNTIEGLPNMTTLTSTTLTLPHRRPQNKARGESTQRWDPSSFKSNMLGRGLSRSNQDLRELLGSNDNLSGGMKKAPSMELLRSKSPIGLPGLGPAVSDRFRRFESMDALEALETSSQAGDLDTEDPGPDFVQCEFFV